MSNLSIKFFESLQKSLFFLKSLVFPTICLNCKMPICSNYQENYENKFDIKYFFCRNCSINLNLHENNAIKQAISIKHDSRYLRKAYSCGYFESFLRPAIHALKYNEKTQLAKILGSLLLATFLKHWDINEIDIIIPMPLYIKRLRQRGFNQVFILFKNWDFEKLNLKIDKESLIRIRNTKQQANLNSKERIENVKNAFKVINPKKIANNKILLIDDVYTTGSTIEECAKVLIQAGAEYIDVLTLAKS